MTVTIPIFTRLWESQKGHYGFHYPGRKCRTTYLVEAEVLNYIGDSQKAALYIPRLKKVYWIEKEKLQCMLQTNSEQQETLTNV